MKSAIQTIGPSGCNDKASDGSREAALSEAGTMRLRFSPGGSESGGHQPIHFGTDSKRDEGEGCDEGGRDLARRPARDPRT